MTTEALDWDWFNAYSDGCAFDDINFIKFNQVDLARQKDLLFAGQLDELDLTYDINETLLETTKEKVWQLLEIVNVDKEKPVIVKEAYQLKLKEQLSKLALVDAIAKRDFSQVQKKSTELYGLPNKQTAGEALLIVKAIVDSKQLKPSQNWGQLFAYFIKGEKEPAFYYQETKESEHLTTEKIVEMFALALEKRGIPWQVKISQVALVVNVNYQDETIYIPAGREMSKVAVEALIEHEIGIHLVRYYNGLQSQLLLLSVGLNGYLKGEEGLASYRQFSIDKGNLPGVINYLGVVLASGLYRNQPWNFRQIFDFIKEYLSFLGFSEEYTKREAWLRALRTFRGSAGKLPTGVFTRDLIYFEGYLEIKDLYTKQSSEIERLLVGKYDPNNEKHKSILDGLGL